MQIKQLKVVYANTWLNLSLGLKLRVSGIGRREIKYGEKTEDSGNIGERNTYPPLINCA